MKNLIDIKDLSVDEIEELIKVAKDIMQNSDKYSEKCKYQKVLLEICFRIVIIDLEIF